MSTNEPFVDITELAYDVIQKFQKTGYSQEDQEKFLPANEIEAIVTPQQLTQMLKVAKIPDSEIHALVNFVCKTGAKRIFLILVSLTTEVEEKLSLLKGLRDDGVTDASLPLGFELDNAARKYWGYSLEGSAQFAVFREWRRRDCDAFDNYQWSLLAPVFSKDKFHFHLAKRRVLPFLKVAPQPASSGFFGEVSKTEIHEAHIDIAPAPGASTVLVAIKKARHTDNPELAKFFDLEADNLKEFQDPKYDSPNIISPIAAYQINRDRCLIFPWANGGNLCVYWENNEKHASSWERLLWVIGQFAGICSALEILHKYNCRHGDLKPENILFFDDKKNNSKSTLQIADMGLAKFHEVQANTNLRQGQGTVTPSGTRRYEPPEMDMKRDPNDPRSRQYDIWSMGCIMLELLIWCVYGYDAVRTFRENTEYFWEKRGDVYTVHSYVISIMDELDFQLGEGARTAYKDLLLHVRTRLLVVPINNNYEEPSQPEFREKAADLSETMNDIFHWCQRWREIYLRPTRSQFPSNLTKDRQSTTYNTVYQAGGKLAPPDFGGGHRQRLPSASNPDEEEDSRGMGPKLFVRAPTGLDEAGSKSGASGSRKQSSKMTDDQEVRGMAKLSIGKEGRKKG